MKVKQSTKVKQQLTVLKDLLSSAVLSPKYRRVVSQLYVELGGNNINSNE